MNATALYVKDPLALPGSSFKPSGVYYCEKCKYVGPSQEMAEQCCQNYKCDRCGLDTGSRSYLRCDACREADRLEKEQRAFAAAEKVTTWHGWVFSEGLGHADGYFESVEDLLNFCEEEDGIEVPPYAWTCSAKAFATADLESVLSSIEDDAYEDFDVESLDGLPELKAAIDRFNEQNREVVSYFPDYTKAITIAKPVNCSKCDGCGRIADDADGTAWTHWTSLPLESSAAVLCGIVKPITCPNCKGTGKV